MKENFWVLCYLLHNARTFFSSKLQNVILRLKYPETFFCFCISIKCKYLDSKFHICKNFYHPLYVLGLQNILIIFWYKDVFDWNQILFIDVTTFMFPTYHVTSILKARNVSLASLMAKCHHWVYWDLRTIYRRHNRYDFQSVKICKWYATSLLHKWGIKWLDNNSNRADAQSITSSSSCIKWRLHIMPHKERCVFVFYVASFYSAKIVSSLIF